MAQRKLLGDDGQWEEGLQSCPVLINQKEGKHQIVQISIQVLESKNKNIDM